MELPGSTPELSYLLAKWGSILPYQRAAEMLGELLPISDGIVSYAILRRHALAVGARLDQRCRFPFKTRLLAFHDETFSLGISPKCWKQHSPRHLSQLFCESRAATQSRHGGAVVCFVSP
jgi:hypothetical protein